MVKTVKSFWSPYCPGALYVLFPSLKCKYRFCFSSWFSEYFQRSRDVGCINGFIHHDLKSWVVFNWGAAICVLWWPAAYSRIIPWIKLSPNPDLASTHRCSYTQPRSAHAVRHKKKLLLSCPESIRSGWVIQKQIKSPCTLSNLMKVVKFTQSFSFFFSTSAGATVGLNILTPRCPDGLLQNQSLFWSWVVCYKNTIYYLLMVFSDELGMECGIVRL